MPIIFSGFTISFVEICLSTSAEDCSLLSVLLFIMSFVIYLAGFSFILLEANNLNDI